MRKTLFIVAALAFLGGAAIYGGSLALFALSAYKPGTTTSSIVVVQKGQTPTEVSRTLQAEGVITSADQFITLGKWTRHWGKIKAGEYKVSGGMSPLELFAVITSGVSVGHPVTIREGENMYEIAATLARNRLVSREAFLALCRNRAFIDSLGLGIPKDEHATLEGYLFPDTYSFNVTMKPEEMIQQMVKRFLSAWTQEESARAEKRATRKSAASLVLFFTTA
jgi:UPF0755 protein